MFLYLLVLSLREKKFHFKAMINIGIKVIFVTYFCLHFFYRAPVLLGNYTVNIIITRIYFSHFCLKWT